MAWQRGASLQQLDDRPRLTVVPPALRLEEIPGYFRGLDCHSYDVWEGNTCTGVVCRRTSRDDGREVWVGYIYTRPLFVDFSSRIEAAMAVSAAYHEAAGK